MNAPTSTANNQQTTNNQQSNANGNSGQLYNPNSPSFVILDIEDLMNDTQWEDFSLANLEPTTTVDSLGLSSISSSSANSMTTHHKGSGRGFTRLEHHQMNFESSNLTTTTSSSSSTMASLLSSPPNANDDKLRNLLTGGLLGGPADEEEQPDLVNNQRTPVSQTQSGQQQQSATSDRQLSNNDNILRELLDNEDLNEIGVGPVPSRDLNDIINPNSMKNTSPSGDEQHRTGIGPTSFVQLLGPDVRSSGNLGSVSSSVPFGSGNNLLKSQTSSTSCMMNNTATSSNISNGNSSNSNMLRMLLNIDDENINIKGQPVSSGSLTGGGPPGGSLRKSSTGLSSDDLISNVFIKQEDPNNNLGMYFNCLFLE